MKKSLISIAVIVSILAVALLSACGPSAAAPAASAPAAAPAGQKTYEFKFANPYTETDDMFLGVKYMIEQLDKRTNGKVKVTAFHNQTLGKVSDHLTMLDTGITDIAMVMPDMFNKVFATPAMFIIGSLGIPDSKALVMEMAYSLYNSGLMAKDFSNYKLLFFEGTDAAGFGFKSKVTNLAELQKLKVRTAPGAFTDCVKALGASPVSIPAGDVYMALDRGTADALVSMPGSFFNWKMQEITKYWCSAPVGIGVNLFVMNKDKWNSLPADIQVTWEQINNETRYAYLDAMDKLYPSTAARFTEKGMTMYTLDSAEQAKWTQLMQPVLASYTDTYQAQGFPIKEASAKIKQVLARYNVK
jgi:TRAP-type transport system periplasmic protein